MLKAELKSERGAFEQAPFRLSTKFEVNASDFLYLDAETSKNQHIASDLWYYNGKGSEPYAA